MGKYKKEESHPGVGSVQVAIFLNISKTIVFQIMCLALLAKRSQSVIVMCIQFLP
jgi:hypothetical protein